VAVALLRLADEARVPLLLAPTRLVLGSRHCCGEAGQKEEAHPRGGRQPGEGGRLRAASLLPRVRAGRREGKDTEELMLCGRIEASEGRLQCRRQAQLHGQGEGQRPPSQRNASRGLRSAAGTSTAPSRPRRPRPVIMSPVLVIASSTPTRSSVRRTDVPPEGGGGAMDPDGLQLGVPTADPASGGGWRSIMGNRGPRGFDRRREPTAFVAALRGPKSRDDHSVVLELDRREPHLLIYGGRGKGAEFRCAGSAR
jgi:hypothetical protein